MANVSLTEQLDQAVRVLFADREAVPPIADERIAPLLSIASLLRDLPRDDFRTQLKNDLERTAAMKDQPALAPTDERKSAVEVSPVREGFRTVTPYLAVRRVQEVIDFVKTVFGAEGQSYGTGSEGGVHSEYSIGGSMLMIGGGGEEWRGTPAPGSLHIYVEDVDDVYVRAVQAGATSLHPPMDQVYGERSAAFRDPGGNEWYPATSKGGNHVPEGAQNLMAYLHPRGTAKQIDFLREALGAEEIVRGESPDGIIYHAKVRIGSSIIELGEAHDQWQPMPAHFMLYVDNVDAWYARAIRAEGAVSVSEPADQPYGARVGAVKDPFDNTWYLATQIKGALDAQLRAQIDSETTKTSGSERSTAMTKSPKVFRVVLEVADLERAVAFYSQLLGLEGRMQRGSRAYFDCGPVILAVLDPSRGGIEPRPNSGDLYFAVGNIEEIYARARTLDCLSQDGVHGVSGGEIVTRPWGERSFYVKDPWGNGLCFVDETTLFTGE
jgi:uncharacterized glyoxalase superfamily protein PhnB/catechol 2,3-dioxygenase-like lactoylglutathione lyase family enzyme